LRFGSPGLAEKLVVQIFARTGGQLLFVVSLIDHLIAQRAPRATVQEARERDSAIGRGSEQRPASQPDVTEIIGAFSYLSDR
jgi:hypothetical protein